MDRLLEKFSNPVSRVLAAADRGALFRTPFKYVLVLLAVLIPLGTLVASYKMVSDGDASVTNYCSDYEENKRDLADSATSPFKKEYKKRLVERCERAREESSTPWLGALGFVLAGVGMGQAFAYRATRIGQNAGGKFPVTPVVAEVLRASGEALAIGVSVMGVFGGLQILIASKDASGLAGPFERLEGLGAGAILGGPIAGFFIVMLTHYFVEVASALVAVANHTAPRDEAGHGAER